MKNSSKNLPASEPCQVETYLVARNMADAFIEAIALREQNKGYLRTYFTKEQMALVDPEQLGWHNLADAELDREGAAQVVWEHVKERWKEFQSRIPNDDEMRRMWRDPYGIGIICGAISGNLEVVDNDAPELWLEYRELIESHDPELYKRLVVIETPSSGKHIPYRCQQIGKNQKLAMRAIEVSKGTPGARQDGDRWIKLEMLFETRGEGGLIVAPGGPLNVHSSGKPYRFIKGSAEAIPTITPEQRFLLLGLARALNEYQPREERHERKDYKQAECRSADGLRPGDDYNLRGDVESVLINHGWTVSHRRGAIVYLKRPGAEGRGHHATLHAVAHNVFFNFSTSVSLFEDMRGYSAFHVYVTLEHNKNYKAATRALAALSYGATPKQKAGSSGEEKQAPAFATELTGIEQIICRIFAEYNISDETFRSYIATRAIANRRKTFRLSGALLARHIKVDPALDSYNNDKVNGSRRLNRMMKELKVTFNYPIFTRIEKARYNPNPRKKSLPAKYRLDELPFNEAEAIANSHLAMQPGENFNPGKACEYAALAIADRYRIGEKPESVEKEKLSDFQQLRNAEDRFEKSLKKIYELMEDMGEPTIEFQNKAIAYKAKVDEILLKRKRKARR